MIKEKSKFDIIAPFYDFMMKLFFIPIGGEMRFRKRILELARIKNGHNILDVGCGTGTFSNLASKDLTNGISIGLDLSQEMLSIARNKKTTSATYFVLGTSSKMPFRSGSFDRVFVTYVLHELSPEQRKQTLREIHRILKPNGLLIATDLYMPVGRLKRALFTGLMMLEEENAWDFVTKGLKNEIESTNFQIDKIEFAIKDFVIVITATPTNHQHGTGNM